MRTRLKILLGVHVAFMCFVLISEQTTFTLCTQLNDFFYNRGGERFLRGTHNSYIFTLRIVLRGLMKRLLIGCVMNKVVLSLLRSSARNEDLPNG